MRSCSFVGNVEALKQQGGVGLGGVAVFFADDAFQFAQPHAVFVGDVGLGVDVVALFHRLPKTLVAHDDGIDDAIGVECELVLAQDTELARTHDCALLRIQFAGQQIHEGGFAGAIGARQSVALSRRERGGDVVEQNFGAVAHGYIAD